jgi:hypothetical protein
MGEVIKVDFQKKKKVEVAEDSNVTKNDSIIQLDYNMGVPASGNFKTTFQLAQYFGVMIRGFGYQKFLNTIRELPYSQTSLALSQGTVADYTDVDLVGILIKSTERDWVVKPAYYNAIIKELEERKFGKNHTIGV